MDWIKEHLGEELYNQVISKLGDTKLVKDDGNFISKQKFDEANEQRKQYKKMLDERDVQLKELSEKAKGNEELTVKIKELEELNKNTSKEFEEKLQKQAFEFSLEKVLTNANAKNSKAIKALLDLEKIKLNGENLEGLEDQLRSIKETDPYLFGEEANPEMGGSKGNFKKTDTETPNNSSADEFISAVLENQAKRN